MVACFFWCYLVVPCTAETDVPESLKIALVHYGVKYKDPEQNLKELLRLNRKAAREGALLILNTELAVSGYSFKSRQDIAPYTETDQGKTIKAMGALARELGVYIGITFPERDPLTESYYNSAFVLDPQGRLVCKYRKIYAERRVFSVGVCQLASHRPAEPPGGLAGQGPGKRVLPGCLQQDRQRSRHGLQTGCFCCF